MIKPVAYLEIEGEWAGSDLDLNRFSPIDDDNNFGNAYRGAVRLKEIETGAGRLSAAYRQRYNDSRFSFFDRPREVEYDRKWNLVGDLEGREQLNEGEIQFGFLQDSYGKVTGGLLKRNGYDGKRLAAELELNEQRIPVTNYHISYVETEDRMLGEEGSWLKQQGRLSYGFTGIGSGGVLTPKLLFEAEDRQVREVATDSLASRSLQFYEIGPGLSYERPKISAGVSVSYRHNRQPLRGTMQDESEGLLHSYSLDYEPGSHFSSRNELTFRRKRFSELFARERGRRDSRGIFLKSNNDIRLFSRAFTGQLLYEANTMSKAILQETFRKVGAEIGQYVWKDLNQDGIQQIDEFFPEQTPNEGLFIKQLVPSDELLPVVDLEARLRTTIDPSQLANRGARGTQQDFDLPHWVKKWKLQSLFELRESSESSNLSQIYLLQPDALLNDSTTINGLWFWRQELIWQPNNPLYGGRVRVSRNRNLSRSSLGLQRAGSREYAVEGRYRIRRRYELRTEIVYEEDRNVNEELASRNYDIRSWVVRPSLEATISRSFQNTVAMAFHRKKDFYPQQANAVQLVTIENDIRAYLWNRLQTTARAEWSYADAETTSSSLGLFELTDGAGEGSHWNWSVRANYRINQLIRASLNYDGRTIENGDPIHTVRMVVSASF